MWGRAGLGRGGGRVMGEWRADRKGAKVEGTTGRGGREGGREGSGGDSREQQMRDDGRGVCVCVGGGGGRRGQQRAAKECDGGLWGEGGGGDEGWQQKRKWGEGAGVGRWGGGVCILQSW